MRVQTKLFLDAHRAMLELGADAMELHVPLLVSAICFRGPEDVQQILSNDGTLFVKSARVAQAKEWLGSGIFSQLDPGKHAAMRQTLNPAFRLDYLRQMDATFVDAAVQLANLLENAAGTGSSGSSSAAGSDSSSSSSSSSSSADGGSPAARRSELLDMQQLFRLMTLDTIGVTSMQHEFNALTSWQQQQQSAGGGGSSSSSDRPGVAVEQMLADLSSAFIWQSLLLPVPRAWLPGWGPYIKACKQLNTIIHDIITRRKVAAARAPGSSSQQQQQRDIVSFLLAAQEQHGSGVITDEQIAAEAKTMMFAGADTSSFTLAVLAHLLACHPAAADAAAAEVLDLLEATGRGSDVTQLRAEDAARRLPYLTGCVNEALRLAPAGPAITRIATQDTLVGGFFIPKGRSVLANLYAMHRHPDIWPQPDAFLPERWLPAHQASLGPSSKLAFQPFSLGPHSCIGRNYAMLQMVLSMAVLLGRGIRFKPPSGQPQAGDGDMFGLEFVKALTLSVQGGVFLQPVVTR